MKICKIEKSINRIVMYNSKLSKNIKLCRSLFKFGVENIDFTNEDNVNLTVHSISCYYSLYGDIRSLNLIENIITNSSTDIELKIYLYWQLVRENFINEEGRKNINLDKLYDHIIKTIKLEKSIKIPGINCEKPRDEKVAVFITNQFTVNEHSPTKFLLSIIKAIDNKFNSIEKIYIFNGREAPINNKYYYYKPFKANTLENYTDEILGYVMNKEGISRCEINYEQGKGDIRTIIRIEEMLKSIVELNPKLIISIGGSSVLADLCNIFTDVYTIGLSEEVPIAKSKYLVNLYNTNTIIKSKINDRQYSLKVPISMSDILIKNNSDKKYSREELGIREEFFLISIVGNRLKSEVKSEFLKLCINILEENKNCALIFIGQFNKEIIESKVDSGIYNRIFYIDYTLSLVSAIELSDLYLNPIRFGGGLSGIAAIKSSIPVISTNVGDVASYLDEEFKVKDYEEMKALVSKLVNNKELYKDFKEMTKALYSRHSESSWTGFINYILKQ